MSEGKMLVACKSSKSTPFGWYGSYRCKPGVKFFLEKPEDFSGEWMDIHAATEEQLKRVPERYRKAALEWLNGRSEKKVEALATAGNAEAKDSPMEPGTLVRRGPGRPKRVAEPK